MSRVLGTTAPDLERLTDEEFLRQLEWERNASDEAIAAARAGDTCDFGRVLQQVLLPVAARSSSKKIRKAADPLWSHGAFEPSGRTAELVALWKKLTHDSGKKLAEHDSALNAWLGRTPQAGTHPLELLILLEWLVQRGARMDEDALFRLWRTALTATLSLEARYGLLEHPDQAVVIRGEIPYRAGNLFSGVGRFAGLRKSGRAFLQDALLEHTDQAGVPDAELVARLPFWIASLTRATREAERCDAGLWNNKAAKRYRKLERVAASLCRPDGRLAMSNGYTVDVVDLLSTAAKLAGYKEKSAPVRTLKSLSGHRSKVDEQRRARRKPPSVQSDEARFAVLRSTWARDADALIVAHDGPLPRIELVARGDVLLSGVWDLELAANGDPVECGGEWECVCWHSDKDGDYIELQRSLGDGLQIERQLLLSRADHFAVFADAIHGAAEARLELCARLPIAPGLTASADRTTREIRIDSKQGGARLFAMRLPAERIHSGPGSIQPDDQSIVLTQTGVGGLFAPVAIDWAPERRRAYADWRILTITEEGRVQPPSVAAGCRLRIGSHQLMVYRSLVKTEDARSLLGHHTFHETIIGKLDAQGTVDPVLLVE